MEFPQKTLNSNPFDPGILLVGIYLKNAAAQFEKDRCTPMFISALFTIAKKWKQPKCPSVDQWIKENYLFSQLLVFIAATKEKPNIQGMEEVRLRNRILFSHKKKTNPSICNHMDGARGCYAQ